MVPPFIELGGRLRLVVNWAPDLQGDEILVLRPLGEAETEALQSALEDAYFDVLARFFPTEAELLGGMRRRTTKRDAR